MRPSDRSALLTILVLGVVVPLTIAVVSGVLGLPHNDDFNYRRVALGLYQEGRLELTGWTAMSLIGQVLLVQPFLWLTGGAPWAFGVMTALLAALGLIASYVLVRPMLSSARALLAVLLVVVFPGFLLNTTTFMTDVPAYALEMVCLVLGVPALRRDEPHRWRWLAASLAVGCLAFSIREFALAAPAAVLLAALLGDPRRWPAFVAAGIGVAIVCGGIHQVSASLPGQAMTMLTPLAPENLIRLAQAIATLAFGTLPALMLSVAWWARRSPPLGWIMGVIVGGVVFSPSIAQLISGAQLEMFVGNLLTQVGAPGWGAMAGERPDLYVDPVWQAMNIAALVAGLATFALAGGIVAAALTQGMDGRVRVLSARPDPWTRMVLAFTGTYGAGLLLFGLAASMFDRYLWPLALGVAVALLLRPRWADTVGRHANGRRISRLVWSASTIALAAWSLAALSLTLNRAAFDVARWRVGEDAVSRGIGAGTVDAGMEWVGYHATGMATIFATPQPGRMWYTAWWPSHRTCAIVSSSLLEGADLRLETADVSAYRTLLFFGPEAPLYLYRVTSPDC